MGLDRIEAQGPYGEAVPGEVRFVNALLIFLGNVTVNAPQGKTEERERVVFRVNDLSCLSPNEL